MLLIEAFLGYLHFSYFSLQFLFACLLSFRLLVLFSIRCCFIFTFYVIKLLLCDSMFRDYGIS